MDQRTLQAIDDALDHINQGVIIFDQTATVAAANRTSLKILGINPKELISQTVDMLHINDSQHRFQGVATRMRQGHPTTFEGDVSVQTSRGHQSTPAHVKLVPCMTSDATAPKPTGFHMMIITDTSLERHREEQLRHAITHDQITRLPNAPTFHARLQHDLNQTKASKSRTAVLAIGVEGLQKMTDLASPIAADKAVTELAERLMTRLQRASDTVARVGPHDFAATLTEIKRPEDALKLAEEIASLLSKPIRVDDSDTVTPTASIGICVFPEDTESAADVFRNATLAMRAASQQGKPAQLFSKDMHATAATRLRMERMLRDAITARNQLLPYFQRIVSAKTTEIIGYEALIRWHHPQDGIISPTRFIALAEETGLINSIGQIMMTKACQQAAEWNNERSVAVNVSPNQFRDPKFLNLIRNTLDWTKLDPQRLTVEITESAVMHDVDAAIKIIEGITEMGVKISLDDFGTGHSSLGQLQWFSLHKLKVDRSFVVNVHTSDKAKKIVQAVVALAQGIGALTVAEGVENEAQFEVLRGLGIDQIQGFLFGKPEQLPTAVIAA